MAGTTVADTEPARVACNEAGRCGRAVSAAEGHPRVVAACSPALAAILKWAPIGLWCPEPSTCTNHYIPMQQDRMRVRSSAAAFPAPASAANDVACVPNMYTACSASTCHQGVCHLVTPAMQYAPRLEAVDCTLGKLRHVPTMTHLLVNCFLANAGSGAVVGSCPAPSTTSRTA